MLAGFHTPGSVAEAVRLKAEFGRSAIFLAGGTRVNAAGFALAPDHLISLAGLGLDRIEEAVDGYALGACVTIQQILENPSLPWPLRRAASQVGNRNIRQAATLGGHLGANEPCADLIPVLMALDARLALATEAGTVETDVVDWVTAGILLPGPGPVATPDGQSAPSGWHGAAAGLIVSVHVPRIPPCRGFGLEAFTRTASDRSIVNAAVSLSRVGERLQRPIVAVGGVGPMVLRLPQVEKVLAGEALPPLGVIEDLVSAHVEPVSDTRGSAAFKRHVAGHLVARAVVAAWQGAGGH